VTTHPDPDALAAPARPGRLSYASPALLRFLASGSLLVGLVAAVYGVAYAINGVTQAQAPVPVSVHIRQAARLPVHWVGQCGWLQAGVGSVTLHAPGSTAAEWLASRGGGAVVGLCMGLGALLLRRLLLSIGRGQPFERGNAARIAGIAGLVVVATVAAGVLPYVGARLVLDRLHLGGTGSPVTADLAISIVPLLLAVFLLAFAEAFRRGTELARDAEGLV
jgi:hypothetical protein